MFKKQRDRKNFKVSPIISTKSVGDTPDYLKLLKLHKIDIRNIDCKIGVIDSRAGGHYEIVNKIVDYINYTNEETAGDIHGTGVAGTISSTYGVSDFARIVSYKALEGATGVGDFRDVATAIHQAINDGVEIINLSLGSNFPSYPVEKALDEFLKDPQKFAVVATGNDYSDTDFPASLSEKYPNLISVGSGNIVSEDKAFLSNFSSRGIVTIIAQGQDVVTTVPGDNYLAMTGTSFATPMVTAVIGLAKSIIPDFNYKDFHDLCQEQGSVLDLYDQGRDRMTGYGYLLPYDFLKNVEKMSRGEIKRNKPQAIGKKVGWFQALCYYIQPWNWF